MKTLKYKPKQSPNDSNVFETNQIVRVFNKINESNLKGWVSGVIEKKKGEFNLINLTSGKAINDVEMKKIFHKSEIRLPEDDYQEISCNNKKVFDLNPLFSISNDVNIAYIIRKFSTTEKCFFCKYNSLLNNLTVFGNDEFLRLSVKMMGIIENHYSKVATEERAIEIKNITEVQPHQSLILSKKIYDLIKYKLDIYKKQYSIKFEIKQKKEDKVNIEWESVDASINQRIMNDINVKEFYFENLKVPLDFFTSHSFPSLKYYLEKFKSGIIYYNLLPVDGTNFNVNVIGNEKIINQLNIILENSCLQYNKILDKEKELKIIKDELDDLNKKYGKILEN